MNALDNPRKKNLYDSSSSLSFKLSQSKVDLFLQCPRCFYLDRKLGISQPSGAPFTLNNAVDTLLKKEFDYFRERQCVHPFVKGMGIDAIPLSNPNIETWRNNRVGVQYLDPSTNFLLYGAIDDVWLLPNGELVIVDYKAKSSTGEITIVPKRKMNGEIYPTDRYLISYRKQMEFYQWLFQKNGFKVSETGYFLFANALKNRDSFDDRLEFDRVLIPYKGDTSWIQPTLQKIKNCLDNDTIPDFTVECEYCKYVQKTVDISKSS